ncbi:MAG: toll/interleukin-1 receptor domain-containing protein [Planctomycetota bacterium]
MSDESDQFDVFLCHNSKDKPAVEDIANKLVERGLKPWLDKWHLRPGFPWQEELEEQIENVKAAAVFVGPSGFGPWHAQEQKAFINEFVDRKCPVIPVILPDCSEVPKLPIFLKRFAWVDFREDTEEALEQLIFGITGENPS